MAPSLAFPLPLWSDRAFAENLSPGAETNNKKKKNKKSKSAANGFMNFMRERREQMEQEKGVPFPHWASAALAIGPEWERMSPQEREHWKKEAKERKKRAASARTEPSPMPLPLPPSPQILLPPHQGVQETSLQPLQGTPNRKRAQPWEPMLKGTEQEDSEDEENDVRSGEDERYLADLPPLVKVAKVAPSGYGPSRIIMSSFRAETLVAAPEEEDTTTEETQDGDEANASTTETSEEEENISSSFQPGVGRLVDYPSSEDTVSDTDSAVTVQEVKLPTEKNEAAAATPVDKSRNLSSHGWFHWATPGYETVSHVNELVGGNQPEPVVAPAPALTPPRRVRAPADYRRTPGYLSPNRCFGPGEGFVSVSPALRSLRPDDGDDDLVTREDLFEVAAENKASLKMVLDLMKKLELGQQEILRRLEDLEIVEE